MQKATVLVATSRQAFQAHEIAIYKTRNNKLNPLFS